MDTKIKHIGVSFLVGVFISSVFFLGFRVAEASEDILGKVRRSQSVIHDTAHEVGECLQRSLDQINYIKAEVKQNGKMMDGRGFLRE